MTDEQRNQIKKCRTSGMGYSKIAESLSLSTNTVKSYCRRNGLGGTIACSSDEETKGNNVCECCGVKVNQNPGRKHKRFCCDKCRNKWWNAHLNQVNRKANYDYICPYCKKPFTAYGNSNRKYCSHECYIADRFGGGRRE